MKHSRLSLKKVPGPSTTTNNQIASSSRSATGEAAITTNTTTENGIITINLLTPVYPQDTPANQAEFEEFFNSGCWSDWNSQLELDEVSIVSEDIEQNCEPKAEQKDVRINITSNKLIRPISRSRGVKDLNLLRESFIENSSGKEAEEATLATQATQATQPEMRLQQMVEEVATSFNAERIEEEIRHIVSHGCCSSKEVLLQVSRLQQLVLHQHSRGLCEQALFCVSKRPYAASTMEEHLQDKFQKFRFF
ncbi:hypothetical protein TcasGA2_TC005027 [Tribolium castaneum]|uniref:Uncharacterized protein n=1 Tax=Tribolium castaneum TaxID=7070 RepID=D7EL57_TRICA|nr:hypothetical protein TcasGA2_TC005027 [Tribolium castaneum]